MSAQALHQTITCNGFPAIELKNRYMAVRLVPELGGKIASIQNLVTGREWLWKSPYLNYQRPRYGGSYVREYDTGGIDECFPTVDACHHPAHPWDGVYLPDHGEVYSQPWQVERCEADSGGVAVLAMSVPGVRLPYRFRRRVALDADAPRIRLDYEVANLSQFNLPFIWCIHPIMAIEPGMRIELPEPTRMKIGFSLDGYPAVTGDSFVWPRIPQKDGGEVDAETVPDPAAPGFRPVGVKLFTEPLVEGWAVLRTADGVEQFRFAFDLDQIRHVAMWINYNAWSGSGSPNYFNLAFEPCIGPCDALDIACRYHRCAAEIPPLETRTWGLGVELR